DAVRGTNACYLSTARSPGTSRGTPSRAHPLRDGARHAAKYQATRRGCQQRSNGMTEPPCPRATTATTEQITTLEMLVAAEGAKGSARGQASWNWKMCH